jgi:antitoxin VapB
MTLHITDPKTDKLARELAKETGESLTTAVSKALQERLDRIGGQKEVERRAFVAELLEIAKPAKGLRRLKKTSRELIEELYDGDGLPR